MIDALAWIHGIMRRACAYLRSRASIWFVSLLQKKLFGGGRCSVGCWVTKSSPRLSTKGKRSPPQTAPTMNRNRRVIASADTKPLEAMVLGVTCSRRLHCRSRSLQLSFQAVFALSLPAVSVAFAPIGRTTGATGRSLTTCTMAATSKVVKGSDDALFGSIERSQQESGKPFGEFLDSGTGSHSLRWIASLVGNDADDGLSISRFCAVTADETMRRNVQNETEKLGIEDKGEVVIGNWAEGFDLEEDGKRSTIIKGAGRHLCRDEKYDTILCDYLIGAVDGFSPYYQDRIFPRLVTHLRPGGRVYVVGLNPIPDSVDGPADVFCRITKLRDACILLANNRCYREYPPDWIERHLKLAGLKVVSQKRFPIMYSLNTMLRQLNVARSKLSLFPSKSLADEMRKSIDELEAEAKQAIEKSPTGRIRLGFDYVIAAELPSAHLEDTEALENGLEKLNID